MRNRANIPTAVAIACVAGLHGCGNVTAGGLGEVNGYMSANEPDGSPSAVASGPSGDNPMQAIVGVGLVGELTVTASLELRHAGGAYSELTPAGEITATLDLQGARQPLFTEVVPAGDYDAVRIVFIEVVADVTAGLEVGGQLITGTVSVDLPAGGREVVRTVDAYVPVGESVDLLVDLNADVWLQLLDVGTQIVAADDFDSAVLVSAP